MEKPKLLVIEDEESIRTQMKWALIQDYDLFFAVDSKTSLKLMERERPPLVILDLGLPPHPEDTSEGLRLLGLMLNYEPTTKVVVVTGNPDRRTALQAIPMGAHDFFTKPINVDELKAILKRAYYVYNLESEYATLQRQVQHQAFGTIIGESPLMQKVFTTIRKVSTTDVPVLVTGASGTGKELVAQAIHNQSIRGDKPFIPINCGAIPQNLMESELFGHEKGAFTGAHVQRAGRIELARGGTLFLDEIAELPPFLQVKLLRFLQDNTIERVGGRETIEIDARIIAATNRDIEKLIMKGQFREDLYYRLAVVTIELPLLKERGEDIKLLARALLKKSRFYSPSPKSFSQEAIETINNYEWPGNVRELENRILRAITLTEGPVITPSDLGFEPSEDTKQSLDLKKARENLEIKIITTAMLKHNGNISKAAEELGISRPTLHQLIKRHNIQKQ